LPKQSITIAFSMDPRNGYRGVKYSSRYRRLYQAGAIQHRSTAVGIGTAYKWERRSISDIGSHRAKTSKYRSNIGGCPDAKYWHILAYIGVTAILKAFFKRARASLYMTLNRAWDFCSRSQGPSLLTCLGNDDPKTLHMRASQVD
jgi:hypothetical protein